jgi:predicted tellurium resistance membrane protein TerC
VNVLFTGEGLISLVSLTMLEIVLGIDNIIFIAILSQKVAPNQQQRVRRLGLGLALGMRIGLLLGLSWLMSMTRPLFTLPLFDQPLSGRDLVLLCGGLFLIAKSTRELFERSEGEATHGSSAPKASASFGGTLLQILILDVVFSLDSVITAVGMARAIPVMVTAMVLAVVVMLIFADPVSNFINRHPSMRVLALAFLLLIGVLLVADSFDHHINKGYVYFAMAFSLVVELLNMRNRGRRKPKEKLEAP